MTDRRTKINPATWQAALSLLRIERRALTRGTVASASPDEGGGAARAEKDLRVAALQEATASLNGGSYADLSPGDRQALQDLISDRIRFLTTPRVSPDGSESDPALAPMEVTSGIWVAVGDVLATERRVLADLESDLDGDINARMSRDSAEEQDHLALTGPPV